MQKYRMAAYMLPFSKKILDCFVLMEGEKEFLRDLGLKIKKLREDAGLSQQELADQAEVAKSTIQRLEKGRFNASILLLRKLAKVVDFKDIELKIEKNII